MPIFNKSDWQEVFEGQISRVNSIVEPDLPPHFKRLNLGPEEYKQILDGWLKPCGELIHLIAPPDAAVAANGMGLHHIIATPTRLDEYIASGLSAIIKDFSQLPPGSKFGRKA